MLTLVVTHFSFLILAKMGFTKAWKTMEGFGVFVKVRTTGLVVGP